MRYANAVVSNSHPQIPHCKNSEILQMRR
jgi:hypothetical protein